MRCGYLWAMHTIQYHIIFNPSGLEHRRNHHFTKFNRCSLSTTIHKDVRFNISRHFRYRSVALQLIWSDLFTKQWVTMWYVNTHPLWSFVVWFDVFDIDNHSFFNLPTRYFDHLTIDDGSGCLHDGSRSFPTIKELFMNPFVGISVSMCT